MPFDPGERTYHVNDERLRAFRALPIADRLRWVEELAAFLRMARPASPSAKDDLPDAEPINRNVA